MIGNVLFFTVFVLAVGAVIAHVCYVAWQDNASNRAIDAARAQTPQPPEFALAYNAISGLWRAERFEGWAWNEDQQRAVAIYRNIWDITPDANKAFIQDALDAREATAVELNAWTRVEAFPSGATFPAEDLF